MNPSDNVDSGAPGLDRVRYNVPTAAQPDTAWAIYEAAYWRGRAEAQGTELLRLRAALIATNAEVELLRVEVEAQGDHIAALLKALNHVHQACTEMADKLEKMEEQQNKRGEARDETPQVTWSGNLDEPE